MRLIDADALKQETREAIKHLRNYQGVAICLKALNDAPTIEAEPVRHGRWIEEERYNLHGDGYCDCKCSECYHRISRLCGFYPDYCENCGARMGGDKDEGN